MIEGVGIDITEIDRIKRAVEKTPSFINKVLTKGEQDQLATFKNQRYWEYIAGRFSLKESFSKAMGTGLGKAVGFLDVEIIDNELGKPEVVASPFKGVIHASVSHSKELVFTEVILEKGNLENDECTVTKNGPCR